MPNSGARIRSTNGADTMADPACGFMREAVIDVISTRRLGRMDLGRLRSAYRQP